MNFRKLIGITILAGSLSISPTVSAQEKKCEGPAQLCQEISELQNQLENQKSLRQAAESKETEEVSKARVEAKKEDDHEKEERMKKVIGLAALMAVVLKLLISSLNSWKGYFTTDKQKAWLKVSLVGVGFITFLLTNIGYGIPWWQALILAGGGPASIAVHEVTKLVPVLRGKKKLAEAEQETSEEPTEGA